VNQFRGLEKGFAKGFLYTCDSSPQSGR